MEWYVQLSEWLSVISTPLQQMYQEQSFPLVAALLLGLLGALAPCQISANMGAISYSANRMSRGESAYRELIAFFAGKTMVYVILGVLIIALGQELQRWTIPVFEIARYAMGPMFLFIGLYLVGLIRIRRNFRQRLQRFESVGQRFGGYGRSFFLGSLISLAFCPTMFVLFFGSFTPLMLSTSAYGWTLPLLFSIGTFVPVLLFIGLLFGFGVDQSIIRRSKQWGRRVQVVAGIIFIIIGVHDTWMYWTL